MFYFSRAKVKIIFPLISMLALISAFFPGHMTYAASVAATSGSPSYQVSRQDAVKVGTVDLMKLPTGKAQFPNFLLSAAKDLLHGSLPLNQGAGAVNVPQAVNVAPSSPNSPPPPPPVQYWNGVSSSDSIHATGFAVQPPDQGLCVSKNHVVEPVNWAVTIYSHDGNGKGGNGHRLLGPISLQSFFNEPFPPKGPIIGDTECYYDPVANAWFAIEIAVGSGKHPTTHFDIAVNPSEDPTSVPWTLYSLDTTDKKRHGCPCWGDEPRLGIDQNNIYIGANEFSVAKGTFLDAEIYAISKSQLVARAQRVNVVLFSNLSIAGGQAFAVQPATSTGSPNAEYFLSNFATASSDSRLGVWALTNGQAVTNGGTIILSNIVISSQAYAQPPLAMNPNSNMLSPDDDRMQQVQFINNELWGSLDTAVSLPGDPTTRAGVEWFIVDPTLSSDGKVIQSASIRDQGAIGALYNYLLYPAFQASASGSAVMVMTLSGTNFNPSAIYLWRPAIKQGGFSTYYIYGPGVNAYNCASQTGVVCRWGDYSAAVIDPVNQGKASTFWVATGYIPDTGSEIPNWGTTIAEVLTS